MKFIAPTLLSRITNFISSKYIYLIFIVVSLLVYGKSLFNGFVWDDIFAIVENPQIQNYTVHDILGFNIFNDGSFYRPFSAFYFFTLHLFFKGNAFFYHTSQLILHTAISIFIFKIFKKFFSVNLAFILSLMFLVHPMNTEPVSFLCGGQAILYSIFGVTALYLIIQKEFGIKKMLLTVLLFSLSIFAKEEGLQYIIIANVFCLIFKRSRFKKVFLISFLSGVIYLAIRLIFANDNFGFGNNLFNQWQGETYANPITIIRLTTLQRLLNVPLVMYYYLKTFIFPHKLAVYQIWAVESFDLSIFILPILFIILFFSQLFLLGIKTFKQNRKLFNTYLFFLIWFLIGLGIHLPILKPFNMTVADRWFYFPIVGLLGLVGVFYQNRLKKIPVKFVVVISILIIILLAIRSHIRSLNFHDNITLFKHDSQVYNNSLIEQNLGYYYFFDGKVDLAIQHTAKSVSMFPTPMNLLNLALELEESGRIYEAEPYYKKANETPSYFLADRQSEDNYFYYARYMLRMNKPKEAINISQKGIGFYPESDRLFIVTALSKYQLKDKSGALNAMLEAIRLTPENNLYAEVYKKIEKNQRIENPI